MGGLEGKLIYVVDDDIGFVKGIDRLLRAHGLRVRTFTSAEAFTAEANPAEADCLILDVQLGGITGIELLNRLSADGVSVPVVIVTASGSDATRRAATAAGCRGYLEKPFSGVSLTRAVSVAIASP